MALKRPLRALCKALLFLEANVRKGKVGNGRWGVNRSWLAYHMRRCKAAKLNTRRSGCFNEILSELSTHFKRNHGYAVVNSKKGALEYRKLRGVRKGVANVKTRCPREWMICSAFLTNEDVQRRTQWDREVALCFSAMTSLMLQLKVLARIIVMLQNRPCISGILRRKWDEASHRYSVITHKTPAGAERQDVGP